LEKEIREVREMNRMQTFLKVVDACFTDEQIPILRQALKSGAKIYLYGRGLGKTLLTEAFRNAGYIVSEPGERTGSLGPLDVLDINGMVAFCVKNTPKERIPNVFDILLESAEEIREWVNQ